MTDNKREGNARAPGKLVLLGEHAVVYGYPALVTTVNQYVTVNVVQSPHASSVLHTPGSFDQQFLSQALACFCQTYPLSHPVQITVVSTIDPVGFGSSSAVTVATLIGLGQYYSEELSKETLLTLGKRVVQSVQSHASGCDIAASIFGHTIYFQLEKEVRVLSKEPLPLVVAFSGQKANTAKLLHYVAKKKQTQPQEVKRIFSAIGNCVEQGSIALSNQDWAKFGDIMSTHQQLQEQLGVSTPLLTHLVTVARENGAWGAKISGAGGGDCIIAFVSEKKRNTLCHAMTKAGGTIMDVVTSVPGASVL